MNEDKKENLFKRLIARFHNTKIAQKLTSLAITSSLVLSLAACDSTNMPDDTNTKDPNNSISDVQNGNNVNNNTNNNQNNSNSDVDVSGYSEILQHLLTDPYYTNLVRTANREIYFKNAFASIPYSFLEDEGHDIQAIKNDELDCIYSSYVLDNEPNNLYMMFGVETKGSVPYYTQYILRYTLSDEEMEDYQMLHNGRYIQAALLNQAISDLKTPTIISESKITVEAYTNLLKSINKFSLTKTLLNGNGCGEFILTNVDESYGRFVLQLLCKIPTGSMTHTSKTIAYATLSQGVERITINSNGAFSAPSKYGDYFFKESLNTGNSENVTVYAANALYYQNVSTFVAKNDQD